MKLYSVRDTLLNYYLTPFMGHDDHDVMAALAQIVNNGALHEPIHIAPNNFEIWSLAEVDNQGNVKAEKTLIANCNSLIRRGIRQTSEPSNDQAQQPNGKSKTAATRNGSSTGTLEPFTPDPENPTAVEAETPNRAAERPD